MSKTSFRLALLSLVLAGAQLTACSSDGGSNASTESNAAGTDASADTVYMEGNDAGTNTSGDGMSGNSTSNGTDTNGSGTNGTDTNGSGTSGSDSR